MPHHYSSNSALSTYLLYRYIYILLTMNLWKIKTLTVSKLFNCNQFRTVYKHIKYNCITTHALYIITHTSMLMVMTLCCLLNIKTPAGTLQLKAFKLQSVIVIFSNSVAIKTTTFNQYEKWSDTVYPVIVF